MKLKLLRLLRGLLKPLWVLLALLLLLEEWLWALVKRGLARLARWRFWAWLEARFRALPPWAALLGLGLPWLLLVPLKLVALGLFAKGRVLLGLLAVVLAKLAGTVLVATVFHWTKPQLLTLPGFARLYAAVTRWLVLAHAWARALPAYRLLRRWRARVQRAWGRWRARMSAAAQG